MIIITKEMLSSLSEAENIELGEIIGIKTYNGFISPIRFELEDTHENDNFPDIKLMMLQGDVPSWHYIYTIYYTGWKLAGLDDSVNDQYKSFHDGLVSILRDRKLLDLFEPLK